MIALSSIISVKGVHVQQTAPIIAHPPNRVHMDKRYGVSAGPGVDLFTGDVIVITVEETNPVDQSSLFNVWALGKDGEILCIDPIAGPAYPGGINHSTSNIYATPQMYGDMGLDYPSYGSADYVQDWSPSLVNMFVVNVIDGRLGLFTLSPVVIFPKAPRYLVAETKEPRSGVANELTDRPWVQKNIQTLAVRSYLPLANPMYGYSASAYHSAVWGDVYDDPGNPGSIDGDSALDSIGKIYIRASSRHGFCACSEGLVRCPHLGESTVITPNYNNVDPIFSRFKVNKVPQQVIRRLLENYFASVRQGVPRTFFLLSQMPFVDRMDAIHFHGAEAQLASRRVYIAQIRVTTRGAKLEQQSTLVLRNLVSDTIRFTFNIQYGVAPEISLGTTPIPIFFPETLFPFSMSDEDTKSAVLYSAPQKSSTLSVNAENGHLNPLQGNPRRPQMTNNLQLRNPWNYLHRSLRTSTHYEHRSREPDADANLQISSQRKVMMNAKKLTEAESGTDSQYQTLLRTKATYKDSTDKLASHMTHLPYNWIKDRDKYHVLLSQLQDEDQDDPRRQIHLDTIKNPENHEVLKHKRSTRVFPPLQHNTAHDPSVALGARDELLGEENMEFSEVNTIHLDRMVDEKPSRNKIRNEAPTLFPTLSQPPLEFQHSVAFDESIIPAILRRPRPEPVKRVHTQQFSPDISPDTLDQLDIITEVFLQMLHLAQNGWLALDVEQDFPSLDEFGDIRLPHHIITLLSLFELDKECASFIAVELQLPSSSSTESMTPLKTGYFNWHHSCDAIHKHYTQHLLESGHNNQTVDSILLRSSIESIFQLFQPLLDFWFDNPTVLDSMHNLTAFNETHDTASYPLLLSTTQHLLDIIQITNQSHRSFMSNTTPRQSVQQIPFSYELAIILSYLYYSSAPHQETMKTLTAAIGAYNSPSDESEGLSTMNPNEVNLHYSLMSLHTEIEQDVPTSDNSQYLQPSLHQHKPQQIRYNHAVHQQPEMTSSSTLATSQPSRFQSVYYGSNRMKQYHGMNPEVLHGLSPNYSRTSHSVGGVQPLSGQTHVPRGGGDSTSQHNTCRSMTGFDGNPNDLVKPISKDGTPLYPSDMMQEEHNNIIDVRHLQKQRPETGYGHLNLIEIIQQETTSHNSVGLPPPIPSLDVSPPTYNSIVSRHRTRRSHRVFNTPSLKPNTIMDIGKAQRKSDSTQAEIDYAIGQKFFSKHPPILDSNPSSTRGEDSSQVSSFFFQNGVEAILPSSSQHQDGDLNLSEQSDIIPSGSLVGTLQNEEPLPTALFPGVIDFIVFAPKVTIAFGIDVDFGTVIEIAGEYALITPPTSSNLGHVVQHIGYASIPFSADLVRSEYWWYAQWVSDMHLVAPPRIRSGFEQAPTHSLFSLQQEDHRIQPDTHQPSRCTSDPLTFSPGRSFSEPTCTNNNHYKEQITIPTRNFNAMQSMSLSTLVNSTVTTITTATSKNIISTFQSSGDDTPPHIDDLEDNCLDPFGTDNLFDRFTIQKASIEKSLYSLINPLGIIHPVLELHHFALGGEYSATNTFFVEFIVERVV